MRFFNREGKTHGKPTCLFLCAIKSFMVSSSWRISRNLMISWSVQLGFRFRLSLKPWAPSLSLIGEKNTELQSGKILSISFRNATNNSICQIACLYDTNKLCVYKVANEKYLIKDDSVDISNIKSQNWISKKYRYQFLKCEEKLILIHVMMGIKTL